MAFMTIRRSFEILELQRGATLDDARQAYKDIVNVWHPDRFTANPRLKHKVLMEPTTFIKKTSTS